MEPIVEGPDGGAHDATPKRSRVKAAVAAVIVSGALSAWGVASVFAASPSPTPAASSGATTTGHTCPADAASSAAPSSTSS
jgi:hypothetical protein